MTDRMNGIRYWEPNTGSLTIKNNIFDKCDSCIEFRPNDFTSLAASDQNVFFNSTRVGRKNTGAGPPVNYITLADWQTQGFDANSANTDPKFNTTYHFLNSSSAINLGTNLTSLGIPALNSDKDGVPRPATGAWEAGVYEMVGLSLGLVGFLS